LATYFGTDVWLKSSGIKLSAEEMQRVLDNSYGVIKYRGQTGGLSNILSDSTAGGSGASIIGARGVGEKFEDIKNKGMFFTRMVDKATVTRAVAMAKLKVDQTWTGEKNDSYYEAIGREADMAVVSTQVATSDINRTTMQRYRSGFAAGVTFMRGARSISLSAILSSIDNARIAASRVRHARRTGQNAEKYQAELKESLDNLSLQFTYHGIVQSAIVEGVNKGKWLAVGAVATALAGPDKDEEEDRVMNELKESALNIPKNIAGLAPFGETIANKIMALSGHKRSVWRALRSEQDLHPMVSEIAAWSDLGFTARKLAGYNNALDTGVDKDGKKLSRNRRRRMEKDADAALHKILNRGTEQLAKWSGVPFVKTATAAERRVDRRRRKNQ
jgi:hypothetical protein